MATRTRKHGYALGLKLTDRFRLDDPGGIRYFEHFRVFHTFDDVIDEPTFPIVSKSPQTSYIAPHITLVSPSALRRP